MGMDLSTGCENRDLSTEVLESSRETSVRSWVFEGVEGMESRKFCSGFIGFE